MHTKVPTASRGQTVGSHGGCFTWHKSNQGLIQANEIYFIILGLLQDRDPATSAHPLQLIAIVCGPLLFLLPLLLSNIPFLRDLMGNLFK